MKITTAWIHQHRHGPGGWTKQQLAAIGVAWPPKHGWTVAVEGREITEAQRQVFEVTGKKSRQPDLFQGV